MILYTSPEWLLPAPDLGAVGQSFQQLSASPFLFCSRLQLAYVWRCLCGVWQEEDGLSEHEFTL